MSDTVLVALVTVVGGGLLGILGTLISKVNRVGKDAAEARDQTANSHTINLRDDIDEKHDVVDTKLDLVLDIVKGLQQSDRNQWSAIEQLRRRK
jgi:hypothetical protein